MNARIRGAAVIVHDDRIALAYHQDEFRGIEWWSPPGGGIDEPHETILACAEREALEETSLCVVADRPIYAQELWNQRRNQRTLELFILCRLADGVSPDQIRPDNEISDARFLSAVDARSELILPAVFQDVVWQDLAAGFPVFRYLGLVEV